MNIYTDTLLGVAVISLTGGVQADAITNPFTLNELGSGYMVADATQANARQYITNIGDLVKQAQAKQAEAKSHEGNCGEDKSAEGKCGEGKCGDNKQS